jgi:hypothetical protein
MLEVIEKGSASESHPVPLLFVHGGEHAAWSSTFSAFSLQKSIAQSP